MAKTRSIRNLFAHPSVAVGLASLLVAIQPLTAQNSAFSYHGLLADQGRPANAIYDLRFTLYDAASDGWVAAEPVESSDLSVTNGLFTVMLDFGSEGFDGGERWLEIAVRPGSSSGDFINVVPRQKIAATPYAIRAANFSGPVDASQIVGTLAPSQLSDGMITGDKLATGAVMASLTAADQGSVVLDGSGVTNLDASNLTSGTIPPERFPSVLPPIDGSQLTGIGGGSGINPLFGRGTNTDLLNPSYRGLLQSTNAYPVVRAAVTVPPDSAQVWQQIYSGDGEAAPFSFVATAVTNGFNPAVNNPSPFSGLSDVQLHYGYNMGNAPGYKSSLPTWVRGFESTWFNPYRPPQLEVYDRVALTNGALGNDVGFGYTLHLESGRVEAAIASHSLEFRNPYTAFKWMDASCNPDGEGVLSLNNGYINFFENTNEWMLMSCGRGIIGNRGSNYLFDSGGGGIDNVTFLKGANTAGSDLRLTLGSVAPRSLRWNGMVASPGWEYEYAENQWRKFNDEVSPQQKSYTIPPNTMIGGTAGDYRTLGVLTNVTLNESQTSIVQFDLLLTGGDDQTSQRYIVPENYGTTHPDWQELLPLHESGRNNVKHYALDTRFSGGRREFRVRRLVTATDVGSFFGIVTTYGGMLWITDVTGCGANASVSGVSANTPLIQTAGKIGINTNNPQAELHVVGKSIVTGTASAAGGFLLKSNSWLAIPTLQEGDVWLGSSNGILHSISLIAGTYTTNRLVP